MKLEIEVNAEDLTKSLKEVLDTLPTEKRMEIAKTAMINWLKEPYDIERKAKEETLLASLREKTYSGRVETDAEVRQGWKFQEAMRGWKSSKETMVSEITNQIVADYKAQVKAVIESDPKIQAMKEEVVKIVKETFPTMVHEAMVAFMASNMNMVLSSAMGVEQVTQQVNSLQSAVAQRLNEVESRVASRM